MSEKIKKKIEIISRRLVVALIKSGWVALAVDACNCKRRKRECAPASRVDKQRRRLTCSPPRNPLRSRACLSDEYPGHVLGLATSVASRPPTFPDDLRAAILPATSPPALPSAMHATPAYRTRLSNCGCACASRRVHRACANISLATVLLWYRTV